MEQEPSKDIQEMMGLVKSKTGPIPNYVVTVICHECRNPFEIVFKGGLPWKQACSKCKPKSTTDTGPM